MSTRARTRGFTGWHMLAAMLGFFGIIIVVNVTMAVFARSSWTGFVVENSYVASQQFNAKMAETRAQAALGWKGTLILREGRASYALQDSNGRPVRLKGVALKFMRPVDDREDQRIELEPGEGGPYTFSAVEAVADGVWLVEIEADAGRETPFRETLRIHVTRGSRS